MSEMKQVLDHCCSVGKVATLHLLLPCVCNCAIAAHSVVGQQRQHVGLEICRRVDVARRVVIAGVAKFKEGDVSAKHQAFACLPLVC